MKTIHPLLLCLVSAAFGPGARATEPTTGKILILDNDRTLEGDIERQDERYVVRRTVGITYVRADRVLKLCASKSEALAFLQHRANLEDPDERLRLARWCHLQGLGEEALKEIKAALALRPDHPETQRLHRYLEESVRYAREKVKGSTEAETALRNAAHSSPPPITITADSLNQFTTRIQPILMNACVRCHSSPDNGGNFQLIRSQGVGSTNRRAIQENLAAVLGQLQGSQPERSPLLVKAVSAHGPTGEPPLKGRQAEAFRYLEDWVKLTLEKNPHLQETLKPPARLLDAPPPVPEKSVPTVVRTPAAPVQPEVPATPAPVRTDVTATPARLPDPAPPRPVPVTPTPTPAPVIDPAAEADPESEFDPIHFNRQAHPNHNTKDPAPKTREKE